MLLVVAVILVRVAVFKTAWLQTAMVFGHAASYLKLDTKIQYVVRGTRVSHGDSDGVRDIKRHATHQISSHEWPPDRRIQVHMILRTTTLVNGINSRRQRTLTLRSLPQPKVNRCYQREHAHVVAARMPEKVNIAKGQVLLIPDRISKTRNGYPKTRNGYLKAENGYLK